MGLFNLIGSMQNLESAEAAGDAYSTRSSLAVNGLGSIVACLFGSCFPTTLYIGHPGWKSMGARAGYSAMSGIVMALLCFQRHTGRCRVGDSSRRRHGDSFMDRHRHCRTGVRSHAAPSRTGGSDRRDGRRRLLGRVHGQGGIARCRHGFARRRAVLGGAVARVPRQRRMDRRRVRTRAGRDLQRDDSCCRHGLHHRTPVSARIGMAIHRRGLIARRSDAIRTD